LEPQGVTDLKLVNQIANYSLLEWPENIAISDAPPSEYAPQVRSRFSADDWAAMEDLHALPPGWHEMPYAEFLAARRTLMAAVIRRGFETLR